MKSESERDAAQQQSDSTESGALKTTTILATAGALVAIVALAAAKKFDLIDAEISKRAVGMLIGAILVGTGNLFPKLVGPIIRTPDRALHQSSDRFAGWTFVLAGIALIGVWLFTPLESAVLISSAIGLTAFAAVAVSWLRLRVVVSQSARADNATPAASATSSARWAAVLILHAIFWTSAMFLADFIWGDASANWVVVAFVISNGCLLARVPDRAATSPST